MRPRLTHSDHISDGYPSQNGKEIFWDHTTRTFRGVLSKMIGSTIFFNEPHHGDHLLSALDLTVQLMTGDHGFRFKNVSGIVKGRNRNGIRYLLNSTVFNLQINHWGMIAVATIRKMLLTGMFPIPTRGRPDDRLARRTPLLRIRWQEFPAGDPSGI